MGPLQPRFSGVTLCQGARVPVAQSRIDAPSGVQAQPNLLNVVMCSLGAP